MCLLLFVLSKKFPKSSIQSFYEAMSQKIIVKEIDWQLFLGLKFLFMASLSFSC